MQWATHRLAGPDQNISHRAHNSDFPHEKIEKIALDVLHTVRKHRCLGNRLTHRRRPQSRRLVSSPFRERLCLSAHTARGPDLPTSSSSSFSLSLASRSGPRTSSPHVAGLASRGQRAGAVVDCGPRIASLVPALTADDPAESTHLADGIDEVLGSYDSRPIGYLDVPADASELGRSLTVLTPGDRLPSAVVVHPYRDDLVAEPDAGRIYERRHDASGPVGRNRRRAGRGSRRAPGRP